MGNILKKYESFVNEDKINEEFIFKALKSLFSGIYKRLKSKIDKLGKDFNAYKKLIKDDIINSKSNDSILTPLFNKYNAKSQWNDQDCFDFISKMIDPDDGVMSQSGIETFIADFKDETEKKMWRYIFESIRNKTIVALQYGGNIGSTFKVGVKLPVPAIKPELKSGDVLKRTKDDKDFIDKKHLPGLKAVIAKLTDDQKKSKVLEWVNTKVIPKMYENVDKLTEVEVDKFSGEGKGTIILGWKEIEIEIKSPTGNVSKYEVIKSNSKKLVVVEGKTIFCDITGDAKRGAPITLNNLTVSKPDGQPFEIDGVAKYETGALDEIVVDGKLFETYKFESKYSEGLDFEKLNGVKERGEEVIFLLPGVDKTSYDSNKPVEEQKEIVAIGVIKELDDKNTDQSVSFDYEGKEVKVGYSSIILQSEKQQSEEAEEAATVLGEIKDDADKMRQIKNYAEFLKNASDDDKKAIEELINEK
jgi:hypothetical protein